MNGRIGMMRGRASMWAVGCVAAAGTMGMAGAAEGAAVLNFDNNATVYGGDAIVITAVDENNPATQYWQLAIGKSTHTTLDWRGNIISFIDLTGASPSHDYADAELDGDGPYDNREGMYAFGSGDYTLPVGVDGATSYSWTRIDSDGLDANDATRVYTVHAPDASGTLIDVQNTITWNVNQGVTATVAANGRLLGLAPDSGDGPPAPGSDIWEILVSSPIDNTTNTGFITVGVKDNDDTAALNLVPGRTFTFRVSGSELHDYGSIYAEIGVSYDNPFGYTPSVEAGFDNRKPQASDITHYTESMLINIAVPEPASAAVLGAGAIALLRRRRTYRFLMR